MTRNLPTPPVSEWIAVIIKLIFGVFGVLIIYGAIGLGAAWAFNLLTGSYHDVRLWQVIGFGSVALGLFVTNMTSWLTLTKKLMFWSVGVAFLPPIVFKISSFVFSWFDTTVSLARWLHIHRYEAMVVALPLATLILLVGLVVDIKNRGKIKPPPTSPEA